MFDAAIRAFHKLSVTETLGVFGFGISIINATALFFDTKRLVSTFVYKRHLKFYADYDYNGSTGKEDLFFRITNHGPFELALDNYVIYKREKHLIKSIFGKRETRVDFSGVVRPKENVGCLNLVDWIINKNSVKVTDRFDPRELTYPPPIEIHPMKTVTVFPDRDVEYLEDSKKYIFVRLIFLGKKGFIEYRLK